MKSNITAKVSIDIEISTQKTWDALTKPELIKKYFFGTDTHTTWEVGSPIRFTGEWEGKTYEDKGTVLAFEPGKMIRYSYWSAMSGIPDKPENYATITYVLSGDSHNSTVTIMQENIPDEKMKEHSEANWKKVLEGMKQMLEK